jgi:hypothetical protein
MTDWLEEYRQRMEKSGEPISSRCSGVPVFSYNNINNNINNISSGKPGTPWPNAGVPGVPEKPEHQGREHLEHRDLRPVFPYLLNDISGITPGTPGTPPGDREGHTNNAATLPQPTLKVLARLREHLQAQGFHGVDLETLPMVALWELCKLKGGPVAFPEDAKAWAALARAVALAREVFGPEVVVEEA